MQESKAKENMPANLTQQPNEQINYEYDTLMSLLKVSVSKHLLDEAFTLVWANDFYYQIIKYSQDEYEALFHNRTDLYYAYHHYEEERRSVVDTVVAALTNGDDGYSIVTRLPVKGGGHTWVRMSATFTDEYIDGLQVAYTSITDIDDLVQAESERMITYNSISGFAARFLITKELHITVLDANEQFKDFFGADFQSASFQELFQRNWDANLRTFLNQVANVQEGKPIQFMTKMQGLDGQTLWMQLKGECVDWMEGDPVYLLIYLDVTDLTDLREMQKKLEDQAAELRSALAEAENANRAKSDFLSRMSHDIRTPMNAIMGMTEIATNHSSDQDKVQDCLRKIMTSSQHLLGLINDVLDMSKIESGQMTLREENIYLPEVMEDVVAIIQPMIKSRGQQFSVRLRNLAHESFVSDTLRLRQCFINILSNATKFTPEGGSIIMDVAETPARQEGTAELVFSFSDTGIGIKPEFLAHIFDAFTREQDGRVDKTEGSGLGMAITKKIVDLMGGEVTVESEVGKGSTFTLYLPLRIDDSYDRDMRLPPLKILVVDDDEIICEYTTITLQECGANALWTNSGAEAIDKLWDAQQNGEDFDAVILDWKMPDQDGLETLRQIRSRISMELPVLIASAYDWSEIEKDAIAEGVNGFLPKPLFRSTLHRGIFRYILGRNDLAALRSDEMVYDFSGRRVLLVEDNTLNQQIAVELLEESGAVVECAGNGKEGTEMFEQMPAGYYDIVLMDLQMPVMDGYQATKYIRGLAREDAADVPIVAMTADAFAEDVAATKEAGMNGHLTKPLNVSVMKHEISQFLNAK